MTKNEIMLFDALAKLVSLKHVKDTDGKTPEYLEAQPVAWRVARLRLMELYADRKVLIDQYTTDLAELEEAFEALA